MAAEIINMGVGGIPLMTPIMIIIAIVAVVIGWKVFKFALKKILAILQGIVALVLIALALAGQPQGMPVFGGLVGLGLLFGAISNIFS